MPYVEVAGSAAKTFGQIAHFVVICLVDQIPLMLHVTENFLRPRRLIERHDGLVHVYIQGTFLRGSLRRLSRRLRGASGARPRAATSSRHPSRSAEIAV